MEELCQLVDFLGLECRAAFFLLQIGVLVKPETVLSMSVFMLTSMHCHKQLPNEILQGQHSSLYQIQVHTFMYHLACHSSSMHGRTLKAASLRLALSASLLLLA